MKTQYPVRLITVGLPCAFALASVLSSPARAEEWLSVSVPAQYDTLTVPDDIRNECIGLDRTVGVEVAYELEKSGFAKVDRTGIVNLKARGKLLALNITDAAADSGEFTNSRMLAVKAELFQDGKSFEWVIKTRTTRGEKAMCDTMEQNATAIARDIHQWLITTLHSKTLPANLTAVTPGTGIDARLHQLQSHVVWIDVNVKYLPGTAKPRVLDDCRVESTVVDQAIATFSNSLTVKRLGSADEAGPDDNTLRFSVVNIKGDGDDASIEKRGMTWRADLLHDGKVVDTFNGLHSTEHGGVFGQVFHTTCEALHDISSTMVKDTYQWYVRRDASAVSSSDSSSPESMQPVIPRNEDPLPREGGAQ
ncbi:MAG TPA: hypothetical protein VG962_04715 [Steroidobacteraceae bacterium]|nr:hypothetical protein [Steroidobacteraceae bacterium]